MLNDLDKEIIKVLQEDLPLEPNPYAVIAKRLGISETRLLKNINKLINSGSIRRFGAVLRHREMGLTYNPMIVWKVPQERVEEVGKKLASYPQVTHCYQRPMLPKLPYNIFTMVHFENKEECQELIKKMSDEVNITEYQLLFSEEEYKKCSMRYFLELDNFDLKDVSKINV